ncbi:MAG TPA: hypothetical protein DD624_05005 [Alphaproteobacteria bacterium]|nr:hypothetical protein [Alphaproteobacteria bacterium]
MNTKELLTTAKLKTVRAVRAVADITRRAWQSERAQEIRNGLRPENLRPKVMKTRDFIVKFTREQPRTAGFIYVSLFCVLSISFFDLPVAKACLAKNADGVWANIAAINPSGWWFLILAAVGLGYMVAAGLSLTTEAFERSLDKAKKTLFVLLALSMSSLFTVFFNILIGRYTPEFLETMHVYGFASFRFRLTETSFPSFGVQSAWAVALAAGWCCSRFKRLFYAFAALVTMALPLAGVCFVSDAVMGAYVAVIMYSAARWIVSENRENSPLFTR